MALCNNALLSLCFVYVITFSVADLSCVGLVWFFVWWFFWVGGFGGVDCCCDA